MSTDISRIAELAKEDPKRQFYAIAHLITIGAMHEAFRSLRKHASAGIDASHTNSMKRTLKRISDNSISGSEKASIGHNRYDESISQKKTGNRGRSRFLPLRIRSCGKW